MLRKIGGITMRIDRAKQRKGLKILVHGGPGIGKTTFACAAKQPTLVIDGEGGLASIPLDGRPLEVDDQTHGSWLDFVAAMSEAEKSSEAVVVVDSIDHFERILHKYLIATSPKSKESIQESWGGYSKAFDVAVDRFGAILGSIDRMTDAGRTVILIAHTAIVRAKNPDGEEYERYEPKLQAKLRNLIEEHCDVIIHARWSMRVDDKGKAVGNGKRIARIVGSPTCCAKNRFGCDKDIALDLDTILALRGAPSPVATQPAPAPSAATTYQPPPMPDTSDLPFATQKIAGQSYASITKPEQFDQLVAWLAKKRTDLK
jgi:hypothetical protein